MKLSKLLTFLFMYCISNAAISAQFYEITNTGQEYPWYSGKERSEYLDINFSYLEINERDKLRNLVSSPDYIPSKGDVGELVKALKNDYVILNVLGNHILMGTGGVKEVFLGKDKKFKEKSSQFYEITNAGSLYSWYGDKESRAKYLDKHFSFIDIKERNKLRHLAISPYYAPSNGNVGKLVKHLIGEERDYVILNVLGNHILMGRGGVKAVNQEKYKKFETQKKALDGEYFGFVLGKTSFSEAIAILDSSKAEYKSNLAYRGDPRLPVIQLTEYKHIPIINGNQPRYASLSFIDNTLYQIKFVWTPKSSNLFDVKKFNKVNVHRDIINGLISKYGSFNNDSERDYKGGYLSHWHFLLNRKYHITLISPKYDATILLYNFTKLFEKSKPLKKSIDISIKNQAAKEKMESLTSQL